MQSFVEKVIDGEKRRGLDVWFLRTGSLPSVCIRHPPVRVLGQLGL